MNTLSNRSEIFHFFVNRTVLGVEALSCISTALKVLQLQLRPYDLLLSDLGLPEIDGWTLTTESEGNIPAIALASDSIKRDRNTAWLLGFQMLLSQPLA